MGESSKERETAKAGRRVLCSRNQREHSNVSKSGRGRWASGHDTGGLW